MSEENEITILGGGFVGISTALHLQKLGRSVTLIHRGDIRDSTSYGNSGIIETSYVLPFAFPPLSRWPRILLNGDPAVHIQYQYLLQYAPWILSFLQNSQPKRREQNGTSLRPLIARALTEHLDLMQNTNATNFLSYNGRVKLHRSEHSYRSAIGERLRAEELGIPFEVFDPQSFKEVEPHVNSVFHKAVRWSGSARLINLEAVLHAYHEKFLAGGGIIESSEIFDLNFMEDQWVVTTKRGKITAQQIVICLGPWSAPFIQKLGYRIPLKEKRGYHRHYSAKDGTHLSHALVDADIGYLLCPMSEGYRITTGVEFAPLTAAAQPKQLKQVIPYAKQLFPLTEPQSNGEWLGSRPCLPDSLPVIDRAPHHQGLWFNFGHGHSGVTIGPSSGHLMAQMIVGEKPFCDVTPYRMSRF